MSHIQLGGGMVVGWVGTFQIGSDFLVDVNVERVAECDKKQEGTFLTSLWIICGARAGLFLYVGAGSYCVSGSAVLLTISIMNYK